MKGSDVGLEWLEADENAMKEPIVIENPEGLGMKMPDVKLTVSDVADVVGHDTPLEVIGMISYLTYVECQCTLRRCRNSVKFSWVDPWEMGGVLQQGTLSQRQSTERNFTRNFGNAACRSSITTAASPRVGLGG